VAERVDEAALPVNSPRCFVITDPVDAAVGSSRHGAFDEAIRVIYEHLDPDRSRAKDSRGVPAVVLRLAEKERATGNGQPHHAAKVPQFSGAPSACAYHRAAAAASGTASITEITGG
jgi:hypothetical protein